MTTPFELDQERSSNQNCHSKGEAGGTGNRYAVTDELVTQSIYGLTATYG
jgi:hypothetical protein